MTPANNASSGSTDLDQERLAQARWLARNPARADRIAGTLLKNEFLPPELQHERVEQALRRLTRYAFAQVPYYRELFSRSGIPPQGIASLDDLARLPSLMRDDLQAHAERLRSTEFNGNRTGLAVVRSSGTTGQPVEMLQTVDSLAVFGWLKQRELRWFRFDPQAMLMAIRPSKDFGPIAPDQYLKTGETLALDAWPLVGRHFFTGRFAGFSDMNPIERQVAELRRHRPGYLLSLAADLEHLALAFKGQAPLTGLAGIESISQQLSPAMQQLISGVFNLRIDQNYGMNEIGLIASRCPEGGRFHIHSEHCWLEIVDSNGCPVGPGQTGRVLITGFSNLAMPLIRYDVDDMAVAAPAFPCPCGRTLPSFADIRGRYRRTAYLPAGTWQHWDALLHTLSEMPPELVAGLRRYQLQQYLSGAFELRLERSRPLQRDFLDRLRAGWLTAGVTPAVLEIVECNEIPRPPGGKFQSFLSEFVPPPDELGRIPGQPAA